MFLQCVTAKEQLFTRLITPLHTVQMGTAQPNSAHCVLLYRTECLILMMPLTYNHMETTGIASYSFVTCNCTVQNHTSHLAFSICKLNGAVPFCCCWLEMEIHLLSAPANTHPKKCRVLGSSVQCMLYNRWTSTGRSILLSSIWPDAYYLCCVCTAAVYLRM